MFNNFSRKITALILFTILFTYYVGGKDVTNQKEPNTYIHDFGNIKGSRILTHNFIFKNNSKKILNIISINTSCGCTVSRIIKKKLLPAETTVIETEFNTKGYSGKTEQEVYLHTDDLNNQILTFVLKADIE